MPVIVGSSVGKPARRGEENAVLPSLWNIEISADSSHVAKLTRHLEGTFWRNDLILDVEQEGCSPEYENICDCLSIRIFGSYDIVGEIGWIERDRGRVSQSVKEQRSATVFLTFPLEATQLPHCERSHSR